MGPGSGSVGCKRWLAWPLEAGLWARYFRRARALARAIGGHLSLLGHIQRNILRHDPRLQLAHLWMLPTPAEEAGRLDTEVADLLLAPVHQGVNVGLLELVLLELCGLLLLGGLCPVNLCPCRPKSLPSCDPGHFRLALGPQEHHVEFRQAWPKVRSKVVRCAFCLYSIRNS